MSPILLPKFRYDYIKKKTTTGSYDAGLQGKLTVFIISTYFIFHVNI